MKTVGGQASASFEGLEEATKLASWLRGPVECAGNVHSDGLMLASQVWLYLKALWHSAS